MSKFNSSLGGNVGAMVAGGAMVVVLAIGAYIAFGRDLPMPEMATPTQPQTASAPAPEPVVDAPVAEVATVQAPSLDELRREGDGTTIIAGRAEPLSDVRIMLDGVQISDTKTDSSGGFAAIAMLPPKQTAQVMTLMSARDGILTASPDEILLAPAAPVVPKPEPVAAPLDVPEQVTDNVVSGAPVDAPEAVTPPPAEPDRVAVLKSDAQGVSLLNPQAMTSVAIDTIGYSDLGEVQLTGRAKSNTSKVRIYLDNRAVISLPVDTQGRWRGDLPDVDEGVYTLRVDEVDAAGAVSSRVETPFKRESAATLAQAAVASDGPIKSITVQTGATLWAIARDRYGDGTLYVRVFEANADSIRDPDLIYPGQVFDLPN